MHIVISLPLIFILISLSNCAHISDLLYSGDVNRCVDYKRPESSAFSRNSGRRLSITSATPLPVQTLSAFPGERIILRCTRSRQNAKLSWYLSNRSPLTENAFIRGLTPIVAGTAQGGCFSRRSHNFGRFGLEALELTAQLSTTGFITCAQQENDRQWTQRESYLVILYAFAKEVVELSFVAHSQEGCDEARAALNKDVLLKATHLCGGHPGMLEFSWSASSECSVLPKVWECPVFRGGTLSGFPWRRQKLSQVPSTGFFGTGPLTPSIRLRFERVRMDVVFDFLSLENDRLRKRRLGRFSFVEGNLCRQAREAIEKGTPLGWIILEPRLGYAELEGGFRLPFDESISPDLINEVDGVQIGVAKGGVRAVVDFTVVLRHEFWLESETDVGFNLADNRETIVDTMGVFPSTSRCLSSSL